MKVFFLIVLFCPVMVFSHGGGVDSAGGHTNQKTGEYHYHNKSKSITESNLQKNPIAYNRDDFGGWLDTDGDCLNTRAELLLMQSQIKVTYKQDNNCFVFTGRWYDPFSDTVFISASVFGC